MRSSSVFLLALATLLPAQVGGHGYVLFPPMRGGSEASRVNEFCPQCGNGPGNGGGAVCGDGNQWVSTDFLGHLSGPTTEIRAGEMIEFAVKMTVHHKGHFEFRICDEQLSHQTEDPWGCLDQHVLHRVRPEELHSDCEINDIRGDCQPIDDNAPGYWYVPPRDQNVPVATRTADSSASASTEGANDVWRFHYRVPADLRCERCTLQWVWATANSCCPSPGVYGCYFDKLRQLGWEADKWCGAFCGSCNAADALLEANHSAVARDERGVAPPRTFCGEVFTNCVDLHIIGRDGTTGSSAMTTNTVSTTTTVTSSTMGITTTNMLTTSVSTTSAGGDCTGEPCDREVHCRSKWGHCGATPNHCNAESAWCGSDTTGCRCGTSARPRPDATTTAMTLSTVSRPRATLAVTFAVVAHVMVKRGVV